jgi:hypothetical protein
MTIQFTVIRKIDLSHFNSFLKSLLAIRESEFLEPLLVKSKFKIIKKLFEVRYKEKVETQILIIELFLPWNHYQYYLCTLDFLAMK